MAILKTVNFSGSNGSHFQLRLDYTVSQSVENNTSTITYSLYFISKDNYSGNGSANVGYINGIKVGSVSSIGKNATVLVGTKTETVEHENDGTKTVNYSASMSSGWDYLGNASLSDNLTLPTIDRLATIKQALDFNDEGNPYVTFDNPADFDVKVNIEFTSLNLTKKMTLSASGYQTSPFTWKLTDEQREQLREFCNDNESCNAYYYLETYKDGVKIGESEANGFKKMYIVNADPTISISCEEQNTKVASVVGSNKILLNNASILKTNATVSTKKGATVKSVYIQDQLVSSPYSKNINIVTSSSEYVINATVIDSRKIQESTKSKTYQVVDYKPVSINSYKFKRENPTSSQIILNAEITYWNSTLNNVANSVELSYSTDGQTYTTIPSSAYLIDNTNHKIIVNNYKVPTTLNYKNQGTYYLKVIDNYTEDRENESVTRGIPVFERGKNCVQVNGTLYIANEDRTDIKTIKDYISDKLYPVGSYYETSNTAFDPNADFFGTWELENDGTVLVSKSSKSGSKFNTNLGTVVGAETHKLTAAQLPKLSGDGQFKPYDSFSTSGILRGKTWSESKNFSAQAGVQSSNTVYGIEIAFGNDEAHNNVQPSKIVNRWHRVS